MTWNWRAIRAVIRKDLRQVLENKAVWLPMVLVPAIIQVILPMVIVLLPTFVDPSELDLEEMDSLLQVMPAGPRGMLEGLSGAQTWIHFGANYMFAPMFLIVPLMVSSILAADSIVGERERKTLEGLLYTPITDTELFAAKVLTAFLPALVISVTSFVLYGIVVNASGYAVMRRLFFPTPTWWPLVFWLGPGISLVGLGVTVLISSRVKTFMQAQQLSGMLVLPIVFLMIGQVTGLFFLSVELLLVVGLLVWLIGLWLIWIGARTFSRGELIARL
ncbi:MAG: hypothetical protein FJZ90_09350 [Chloroflexi bacterium]|nr:hypothetical protein [Chloroflexota bacterium]